MGKVKNLEGQKFGRLAVSSEYELRREYNSKKAYWLCICDCGNKKWIRGSSITSGSYVSCGCYRKENNSILMKNRANKISGKKDLIDLSGKRFGKLVVTSSHKRFKSGKRFVTKWLCKCDCGDEKWIQMASLVSGKKRTRSCGCLAKERASEVNSKKKGEAAFNAIYSQYRNRANRKGIVFRLNKEEFKEITQKNCSYCGSDLSNYNPAPNNNGGFHYNGIDRVVNLKGYELDNCVPCCSICNRAKDIMSKREFIEWIKKVYYNLDKNEILC
ncbi:MAG: hypothetical protein ACTSSP_09850 [Candidatus Asgardarchaeia archaeon]